MAKLPRNVRKSIFSKIFLDQKVNFLMVFFFGIKILSSNSFLKFEIKGPTSIVLGVKITRMIIQNQKSLRCIDTK